MTTSSPNFWVLGLWHQGVVASAVLADWGFSVTAICSKEQKNKFEAGELPVFEPNLAELIKSARKSGKLCFLEAHELTAQPDGVFISHDTLVDEADEVDLSQFWSDCELLGEKLITPTHILVTAQVPVGTTRKLENLLTTISPNSRHTFSYMPENLRLGDAIKLFESPALPVIGVSDPAAETFWTSVFIKTKTAFEFSTIEEAEILKSALNTFLALSITFGNEIAQLSEAHSSDGSEVMRLLRKEPRIGNKLPLLPGLPFSGGTLARDVRNLIRISNEMHVKAPLINAIWDSNQTQKDLLLSRVISEAKIQATKSIGLLGLTYKPNTSTLRRSLSMWIAERLTSLGYEVLGTDPMSHTFAADEVKHIHIFNSVEEVNQKAELLVLMTPWNQILDEISNIKGLKKILDPSKVLKINKPIKLNETHTKGEGE